MEAPEYWNNQYARLVVDKETAAVNYNEHKLRELTKLMVEEDLNGDILEVGCGMCLLMHCLRGYGKVKEENYYGIDLSSEAIQIANKIGFKADVKNVFDLDKTKKYDTILFMDSFEHILCLDDLAFLIKEVIKPNGIIYINIPLSVSGHSEDFDYYVREDNIVRFFSLIGIKHYKKTDIEIPQIDRKYQLYKGVFNVL